MFGICGYNYGIEWSKWIVLVEEIDREDWDLGSESEWDLLWDFSVGVGEFLWDIVRRNLSLVSGEKKLECECREGG